MTVLLFCRLPWSVGDGGHGSPGCPPCQENSGLEFATLGSQPLKRCALVFVGVLIGALLVDFFIFWTNTVKWRF